jgi:hypothetical protein
MKMFSNHFLYLATNQLEYWTARKENELDSYRLCAKDFSILEIGRINPTMEKVAVVYFNIIMPGFTMLVIFWDIF